MPGSAGISGNTAAPAGTSSAMSAPGDRGDDVERVAVLDLGRKLVQVAHVFLVQKDVQVHAHLIAVENLRLERWKLRAEIFERRLDGVTFRVDHRLAAGLLAQQGRNRNLDRHE